MKNLEKVFYMICGVALVFVGIIIGGLLENDADAQTESNPEYKVDFTLDPRNSRNVQSSINDGCKGGYVFHQMVVTKWDRTTSNFASEGILIFKKK